MPTYSKSEASQTFSYAEQPAVVARACQEVLIFSGELKSVNRDTGIVTGSVSIPGWAYSQPELIIQISSEGGQTTVKVDVQLQQDAKGDGAGKALAKFANELSSYPDLVGKSKSGW